MSHQLSLDLEIDQERQEQFRGAFLGAAIGDALGFITEFMRSSNEIRDFNQEDRLTKLIDWQRPTRYYNSDAAKQHYLKLPIPTGTYSDDTQLTLATARSIGADGSFNVETFSKYELPLWLHYELGGGSGSKAAARNLLKPNVKWYDNFYESKFTTYTESGGNGAAMRILPIALVNINDSYRRYLDIWRNAITTHGHPRGILGALLLADTITTLIRKPTDKTEWLSKLIDVCDNIYPKLIEKWVEDKHFIDWKKTWNNKSKHEFDIAWKSICKETSTHLRLVRDRYESSSLEPTLNSLGCFKKTTKGAGNNTVIAAILFLSHFINFNDENSNFEDVILPVVNQIGIDTDTIAYFVGAMFGSYYGTKGIPNNFKTKIQDSKYLIYLADWCYQVQILKGELNLSSQFQYQDSEKSLKLGRTETLIDENVRVGSSVKLPVFGSGKVVKDDDLTPYWKNKHVHFIRILLDLGQSIFLKIDRKLTPTKNQYHRENDGVMREKTVVNSLSVLNDFRTRVEKSNFSPDTIIDILREIKFDRNDKAIFDAFNIWLWGALPNSSTSQQSDSE